MDFKQTTSQGSNLGYIWNQKSPSLREGVDKLSTPFIRIVKCEFV